MSKQPFLLRPIVQSWLNESWEIYGPSAQIYIGQYLEDLDLIDKGINVDYEARRQETHARILTPDQEDLQLATIRTNLSSTEIPSGSIAFLKLQGAMRLQDGWSSTGVQTLANQIDAANENPNISGILLQIDSGGGEAVSGSVLLNAIREFKKPIHGYVLMMASAALRGTLPIDQLTAAGAEVLIGSIGTKATLDKRVLKFMEEHMETVYAPGSTMKDNAIRKYMEGNNEPLIQHLDEVNQIFIDQVREFRNIIGSEEQNQRAFAGDIFTAQEAVQVGLIDQVGSINVALQGLRYEIAQEQATRRKRIYRLPSLSNNQNFQKMNFTNQLWDKARQLFQTKLGFEVAENATPEQVVEALENAPSVEDRDQRIIDAVVTQVQEQINAGSNQEQDPPAGDGGEGGEADPPPAQEVTMESLQESINQLTQSVADLQSENADLRDNNNGLSGKVATLTGKALNKVEGQNPGQQLEHPAQTYNHKAKVVPGTSKY